MCVVALKSMTYAIKTKRVLEDSYIDSEIIKLEPSMTKKGCSYGVKFNCVNLDSATNAIRRYSIKYSELIRM